MKFFETNESQIERQIDNVRSGETGIFTLVNYQICANSFINRPQYTDDLDYLLNSALGITGEGGEFADIVKKVRFHGHPLTDELRTKLKKEIGDVLWYLAQACIPLDTDLAEIATLNIRKLGDRHGGGKFSEQASRTKDETKEAI